MAGLPVQRKRLIALALGLAVLVSIVVAAVTQGLGRPGVESGAVISVEDVGDVSQEQYDRAAEAVLAGSGLQEPPAADDPVFAQFQQQVVQPLIQELWIRGEAAERDISASDQEVADATADTLASFEAEGEDGEVDDAATEKAFRDAAERAGYCSEQELDDKVPASECQGVIDFHEIQVLSNKLSESVFGEIEVSDSEIEDFYEENEEQYSTPATRVARVILNEDEAEVEKAVEELGGLAPEDDGFGKAWQSAARNFSEDGISKDSGGLLTGLVEGQGDPGLDERIFSLGVGEQSEIFETPRGFYFVQVVGENPAGTTELNQELRGTIAQIIEGQKREQAQADFAEDFQTKWQLRTACTDAVSVFPLCRGAEAPEQARELPAAQGGLQGAPAVISPTPKEPGTNPGDPADPAAVDPLAGVPSRQGPKVAVAPPEAPEESELLPGATELPPGAESIPPTGGGAGAGGAGAGTGGG